MKKILSIAAAMAVVLSASPSSVLADDEPAPQQSVFKHFNPNDVNGKVIIKMPENLKGNVLITFDSPERTAEPYYFTELAENGSCSFAIEGYDNTADDYRNYSLTLNAIGGQYGDERVIYTDSFSIPDPDNNPDSFTELTYNFAVDDVASTDTWSTSEKDGVKTVTFHINAVITGDVDGNSKINASDASLVLMEYSALSTTGISKLSERQKKAADVNGDNSVNASDASKILAYYAAVSTGATPTWD
jgi:hypothetical protein